MTVHQPQVTIPNYLNMFNTQQYVQQAPENHSISIPLQNLQKDIYTTEKKNGATPRRKFTDEEDKVLKSAVNVFGTSNWKIIASLVPGRNPRQCRDRYTNYLAPGLVRLEWSDEEDKLLAEKFKEFGPKWTKIRQYFPTRSANDIKNRYNYTVCHKYPKLCGDFVENVDSKDDTTVFEIDDKFNIFNDDFIGVEDFFVNGCFLLGNENLDQ